jgi:hypothetical protein
MASYTLVAIGQKITVMKAPYIEHGWYIEIVSCVHTLMEIPFGGGDPQLVSEHGTLSEAIEAGNNLT